MWGWNLDLSRAEALCSEGTQGVAASRIVSASALLGGARRRVGAIAQGARLRCAWRSSRLRHVFGRMAGRTGASGLESAYVAEARGEATFRSPHPKGSLSCDCLSIRGAGPGDNLGTRASVHREIHRPLTNSFKMNGLGNHSNVNNPVPAKGEAVPLQRDQCSAPLRKDVNCLPHSYTDPVCHSRFRVQQRYRPGQSSIFPGVWIHQCGLFGPWVAIRRSSTAPRART